MLLGTAHWVQSYAIFPHLETIGKTAKCQIFQKWHDEVMEPAINETIRSGVSGHLGSHELVLLQSEWPGDPPTPVAKGVL